MALKRGKVPGEYTTPSGWRVFRSFERGGLWAIVNPDSGDVLDALPTLREIRGIYA